MYLSVKDRAVINYPVNFISVIKGCKKRKQQTSFKTVTALLRYNAMQAGVR